MNGWRYWYRRYLGWLPVQFCMVCGKPYWGGWPVYSCYRLQFLWLPWWKDYCSRECADEDLEMLDRGCLPRDMITPE